MVVNPLLRCGCLSRFAWLVAAVLAVVPRAASADILDKDSCARLEVERESLVLLGVEKYIEQGPIWAKDNLKVADLNLVKRYLDIYEQLKFRCKEDIDLIESDAADDEDEDEVISSKSPPMPVRRPEKPAKGAKSPGLAARANASAPNP